jgi:hypothetical protein
MKGLTISSITGFCFLLQLQVATISAQTAVWTDIPETQIHVNQSDRQIIPLVYRTLQLDFFQLKNLLSNAPGESEVIAGAPGIELLLPMPDGGMARFRVWNAPIMHPDLAAQYPDIQTFAGKGIDMPTATLRMDVTPGGFHAMVLRTGKGSVFIDPYAKGNTAYYNAYYKKDFVKSDADMLVCHVDNEPQAPAPANIAVGPRAGDCGNLRTYRLALACTGEYANFHGAFGADKAPALAAMVVSMNRVNGVYEIDCGIRMIIIGNNSNIIYTNPATDPYTNNNGSTMLGQNQSTCDAVIGSANYDIGHVFSTGGGGVANLNGPCNSMLKARGVTGGPSPVGDPFDIDYVAHEMGHQFGADHTQYNNCNRVSASAMEPGSASTIMGYAGICAPNVQNNSDAYFHARSIFQIANFVVNGNGNSCDVPVANGNTAPTVGNVTDKTIPISTPFILSAIASDPNGTPLSYCWEQMNGYSAPMQPMPPVSTNSTGPMFRTFDPTGSPSRYFPNFNDVLDGINPDWEELPSISRTMLFRVTVRDNNPNGGCTAEDDVTITTAAAAGPFLVTSPNAVVSYNPGSMQTVTWNVANTTASPVSCANVDILISTDGGQSFTVLLANTPNDGGQLVTMPNVLSDFCRIMVRCTNNYFYDVSNVDFQLAIQLPVELTDFNATLEGQSVVLKWTTASEQDNEGFFVERSTDGGVDFRSVGWVDGKGTTSGIQHYSFTDTDLHPGQVHYYRLRQIDRDGSIHYSTIRVVYPGKSAGIAVYPNPATGSIGLTLPDGWSYDQALVRIWNMTGKLEMERFIESGDLIDIQALPAGLYRLELSAEGVSRDAVFVKQ